MAWTTTQFLTALKRNVTVPANNFRFTDTDLLSMADEQMQTFMLPLITSLRQEFFVRQENVALVADQANYKIPYRAVGRTLREIKCADSISDPQTVYNLVYVLPEDTQRFIFNNVAGNAVGYTVRGDNIVILPTPNTGITQNLQFFYELIPSQLIAVEDAGVVSSVNTGTGAVTMVAAVDDFATGDTMDLVDYQSGNAVIGLDLVNASVSSNIVTFDPDDLPVAPNALKAGDYVCLANQTPVLQIPNEAFFVMVQAVSVKVLEAQGDFEGMNAAQEKLKENIEGLTKLLVPRVESDAPTIINNNGLISNRNQRSWLRRYTYVP